MWDKMTLYDSKADTILEFDLVNWNTAGTEQQGDQEQQEQQSDQEQQSSQDENQTPEEQIITRHLAKYMPVNIASRRQVMESVSTWPAWVQIDLSKAFGCSVRRVPGCVADYLDHTNHESTEAEKAEIAQTESGEQEKNSEK